MFTPENVLMIPAAKFNFVMPHGVTRKLVCYPLQRGPPVDFDRDEWPMESLP